MEIFFKVVLTSEKHFLRYRRERDFYYLESESESRSVLSDCLRPHGLYSSWKPTRQNTVVGSLSFLQGIFPSQGFNPGLLHCRQILYSLSFEGGPSYFQSSNIGPVSAIFEQKCIMFKGGIDSLNFYFSDLICYSYLL